MVGSRPQSPPSTTASSACPIDSRISQPLVSGSVSPGRISVDETIGSPSSASSACVTGCAGMRTPTVSFFGCIIRRGTSRSAGRMNV